MGKTTKNSKKSKKPSAGGFRHVRTSTGPLELYAQVTRYLGNSMCHVLCSDLKTRLCFIRGKFKGRGKRDNRVETFTWVLIGLRDWASSASDNKAGKLDACDLLEVYSELDKPQLRNKECSVNWNAFTTVNTKAVEVDNDEAEELVFRENSTSDEYAALIASSSQTPSSQVTLAPSTSTSTSISIQAFDDDGDEILEEQEMIDIDDI
jgi:hypothetical protein